MFERLKSGWTTLKFIRVGLAGLILYSSIESVQVIGIILGTVFMLFSLFTDGVCGIGNNCYQPVKKDIIQNIEDIQYEELDSK